MGAESSLGGTSAVLHEKDSSREDDGDRIDIPDEYMAEAFIYPAIAKGYVTLQGLGDGSVSFETFMRAKRMYEFDEWLQKRIKDIAISKKPDEVEYFD